ncbi:MAG: YfhO family protein [bacterium]|nr:YfhO family protein [bacterium]
MNTDSAPRPRYALLPLFLTAVALAWAAPEFWTHVETRQGNVTNAPENSDLYQSVYPSLTYGFGRLRNGELPAWNPRQFCGVPHLADPRSGVFQPLNVVFLFLPIEKAMALHAFMCLFLMGFFAAGFARSLGVASAAALTGGVVYAFCGASAAAMSRPAIAAALTWVPLLFWALREYSLRCRYASAMAAGLACAALLLSGAYGIALAAVSVACAYACLGVLLPGAVPRPRMLRRVEGLLAALAVAVAVSCVQWLPALLWVARLDAPAQGLWNLGVAGHLPADAGDLMRQAFMAKAGMLPRLGYVGIATLLLIPAALFHRNGRYQVLFFLLVAALLVAASVVGAALLPAAFPAYACLYGAAFAVSVLAAFGADRLLTPRHGHRSQSIWAPAITALVLTAALFAVAPAPVRVLTVVFAAILVPFFVFRVRVLAPVCGTALATLIFVDLALASSNAYRHPFQNAPECYERYGAALESARENALGGRVIVSADPLDHTLPANIGMLTDLDVADGAYIPLTRGQAAWWRKVTGDPDAGRDLRRPRLSGETVQSRLLDCMAVRALVVAPGGGIDSAGIGGQGRMRELLDENDVRVLVNDGSFPRAYWVPAYREVDSVDAATALLADPAFDPATTCAIVRSSPTAAKPKLSGGTTTTRWADAVCSVEDVSQEEVVVRVDAPAQGIVILADSYAPEWKATLDGASCDVLQTNGVFRGVRVEAGEHELMFRYRPWWLPVGAGLSVTGLIAAAAIALGSSLRG